MPVAAVSVGLYFTLPEHKDEAQQVLAEGEGEVRVDGQGRVGVGKVSPNFLALMGQDSRHQVLFCQ